VYVNLDSHLTPTSIPCFKGLVDRNPGQRCPENANLAKTVAREPTRVALMLKEWKCRGCRAPHGSGTYASDRKAGKLKNACRLDRCGLKLGVDPFFSLSVKW